MRRRIATVCLTSAFVLGLLAPFAIAQETKSARGTVTSLAGDMLTVRAGTRDLTFTVDAKTVVTAEGAGTATRQATAAGKAGPKLSELLKTGEAVEVSYHELGGRLHAVSIRRVASTGAGGGPASEERAETSTGTVDAVTATSLTISGSSGGGGTFKQTFVIDSKTSVVGVGAGTAAAARGGRMVITEYLGPGDRVTVSYHKMSDGLHAAEVRVTAKAKK